MSEQASLMDTFAADAFCLRSLQLYNWGPFSGRHCIEIDPKGSAIIGQTGSGKTTLVDAFMTLISARPLYNLASTGGHESDRDLVSYIRGVSGAGNNSGENEHIARAEKTVTALSASFVQQAGERCETLSIAGLFVIDSSSSAMADIKRFWLLDKRSEIDLSELLNLHQAGGIKAVKQLSRDTNGFNVYDSKKAYLAQLQRFFEVGDNAFSLLNRAAGLKQLNSIDTIFRELVLDDKSVFGRAAEVAAEFDDLTAIHSELHIARQQRDSLLPIAKEQKRYDTNLIEQEHLLDLRTLLPRWFADQGQQLWQHHALDIEVQLQAAHTDKRILDDSISQGEGRLDQLHEQYLQLGGGSIEQLQQQLTQLQRELARRQLNVQDYRQLSEALELDSDISVKALASNQRQSDQLKEKQQSKLDESQQLAWQKGSKVHQLETDTAELAAELARTQQAGASNIPYKFQQFKAQLAEQLGLESGDLAFVAELLEVQPEHQSWRGAIERALGANRLRLLVPEALMSRALSWVNSRDNQLHVRILSSRAHVDAEDSVFFDDGYARKLNVKEHPLQAALIKLLAAIDRHCVDSPSALKSTEHAMTDQGLMSAKKGSFEKQDQRPLQQGWLTGFDNKDRLALLQRELDASREQLLHSEAEFQQLQRQCSALDQSLGLLERLQQLDFSELDIAASERDIDHIQNRLAVLLDPNSDSAQAQKIWESAKQDLQSQRQQLLVLERTIGHSEDRQRRAKQQLESFAHILTVPLTEAEQRVAADYFSALNNDQREQLSELEKQAASRLQEALDKKQKALSSNEGTLGKLMEKAQRVDTGALAEVATELQDVPRYLDQLALLNSEALPEKLQRFQDYLNQSSDQGVTQLLSSIDNEVSVIEERIDDLNDTMARVDFQQGRYLSLRPRRVKHESLRTLLQAQKNLRQAALEDDDGESHYQALVKIVALLRDAVDRKKTQGAKALLDPRFRLQFAVSVIDRDSQRVIETRTGSQGGSGGEKEIIASYILTASLSYALCPDGSSKPLFGTIVLDEAFSKSSLAVATRIISALREFGLHPLFITPNKEMSLLRAHTRSAVLVHRRGLKASTASLSWEELDEKRIQRTMS